MSREEIIETFLRNAAKTNAESVRVSSTEEMNEVLTRILRGRASVFCPGLTDKEKAVRIPEGARTDDFGRADTCVEEVFGAVAETGSLICTSSGGKTVQAGLLPPHHVAIVDSANIFAGLEDFLTSWDGPFPTNITLEAGPSRTADIELTLTIGVHGPGRVDIIVL
ncbi:MAG: lactate utilization protein [Pseudomonadota bacterium]